MQQIGYVDDYMKAFDREKRRKEYRNYREGFSKGRAWQHKCEVKDRTWNYAAVAVIAFTLGVWLGTAFTNGTW